MKHLLNTEQHTDVVMKEYDTVWYTEDDEDVYFMKPNEPLCFIGADTISSRVQLTNTGGNLPVLYTSTDEMTWVRWNYTPIFIKPNECLYVKGENPDGFNSSSSKYSTFTINGKVTCEGNVMSLLGTEVEDIPCNYCFYRLFYQCVGLTSAPSLPSKELKNYCYAQMFRGCTNLTKAPILHAMVMKSYCYQYMFEGCTSLLKTPQLPAMILAQNCYDSMFFNCTNLTTAMSILPATELAPTCYSMMFTECHSLTAAPVLPATELKQNCYTVMFGNCTSLTKAPKLPATTLALACYSQMFQGCSNLTSASVILPALTLSSRCYERMFYGCTSLTKAPKLPATTLAGLCYNSMFSGCTSLNYVKAMFTTIDTTNTNNWLSGVSSTGVFVKNAAATWNVRGDHGIPVGWTVETATK